MNGRLLINMGIVFVILLPAFNIDRSNDKPSAELLKLNNKTLEEKESMVHGKNGRSQKIIEPCDPLPDSSWSTPPEGYTRMFFEYFLQPYTGDNSWQRSEDLYDPWQTYAEWWVEEISDGIATGNMVRVYHWSPRHFLEIFHDNPNVPVPAEIPPAEPLPQELACVASMENNGFPTNTYKYQSPWKQLGDLLYQPLIAAGNQSYTWLDIVKDSWTDERAGSLNWWNGFAKDAFFLSDSKPPVCVGKRRQS